MRPVLTEPQRQAYQELAGDLGWEPGAGLVYLRRLELSARLDNSMSDYERSAGAL